MSFAITLFFDFKNLSSIGQEMLNFDDYKSELSDHMFHKPALRWLLAIILFEENVFISTSPCEHGQHNVSFLSISDIENTPKK